MPSWDYAIPQAMQQHGGRNRPASPSAVRRAAPAAVEPHCDATVEPEAAPPLVPCLAEEAA